MIPVALLWLTLRLQHAPAHLVFCSPEGSTGDQFGPVLDYTQPIPYPRSGCLTATFVCQGSMWVETSSSVAPCP